MLTIRKWIRFLFGFSGTETNGFLILSPLLLIILLSQPVYRAIKASSDLVIGETDRLLLDSIMQAFENSKNRVENKVVALPAGVERHLTLFNPNTASEKLLQQVGFDATIAKRIISYRSKGGKFITKPDLLKVFGMDTLLYKELYTYIDLPETRLSPNPIATPSNPGYNTTRREEKFDLNNVDTTELKTVFGIGSKRAKRIVAYRNSLGGFLRAAQLNEVYGLDSAAVEQLLKRSFITDGFQPFRLDLNKASERELSAHPYISPLIAKAIVAYRFQHGDFAAVEEIRNLRNLKKEEADKIIPYLDIKP